MEPRKRLEQASAAQAIVTRLAKKRASGEAKDIGLIIEA